MLMILAEAAKVTGRAQIFAGSLGRGCIRSETGTLLADDGKDRRRRSGDLQFRHRPGGKKTAAQGRDATHPPVRVLAASTVRSDPSVRIHLAIQFGDQHEGQPRLEALYATGP